MQKLYPDDFANKLRKYAGKKYRPSNGTEGELFMSMFCDLCIYDDYEAGKYCPILSATFIYEKEDDLYPAEWQYGEDGQPKCTAFEGRNNYGRQRSPH